MESDYTSPNYIPSVPEVWYEDGNLILETGDTRFRISRGILASKSSPFREMVSLPQPLDEELVDGCPIVKLHDSPHDLGYFLKAIYDSSFFEPPPSSTDMNIIAGVLRLSTKYDVDYLRQRSIRHLETLYPLTLSAFDNRQDTRTAPWKDNTAFFVATLAREMDLLWILPSALYCVCSCPVEDIVEGFEWNGSHMRMTKADRGACLRALLPLANSEHREILAFLTLTHGLECESLECHRSKLDVLYNLNATRSIINPLDAFYEGWYSYSKAVCPSCLRNSQAMYNTAREALWDTLPVMFDLPRWEKLEKIRQEAFP